MTQGQLDRIREQLEGGGNNRPVQEVGSARPVYLINEGCNEMMEFTALGTYKWAVGVVVGYAAVVAALIFV